MKINTDITKKELDALITIQEHLYKTSIRFNSKLHKAHTTIDFLVYKVEDNLNSK